MSFNHTEDSLKTLTKEKLVNLALHLQEKANSLEEIKQEISRMTMKLEGDIFIVQNVNTLLSKKVTELEQQMWSSYQYGRRESLEIQDIPSLIPDTALEDKVRDIFGSIGVNIDKTNIEGCHRLKRGITIIKLSKRKDREEVYKSKNKLKDFDVESLGFEAGTSIYINESLTSYYKMLWSKAKKLYKDKKIHTFYTSNGTVKIKLRMDSNPISITHRQDLGNLFPDIDFENY